MTKKRNFSFLLKLLEIISNPYEEIANIFILLFLQNEIVEFDSAITQIIEYKSNFAKNTGETKAVCPCHGILISSTNHNRDCKPIENDILNLIVSKIITSENIHLPSRENIKKLIDLLNVQMKEYIDFLSIKYGISAIRFLRYFKIDKRIYFLEKFFEVENFFNEKNIAFFSKHLKYISFFDRSLILETLLEFEPLKNNTCYYIILYGTIFHISGVCEFIEENCNEMEKLSKEIWFSMKLYQPFQEPPEHGNINAFINSITDMEFYFDANFEHSYPIFILNLKNLHDLKWYFHNFYGKNYLQKFELFISKILGPGGFSHYISFNTIKNYLYFLYYNKRSINVLIEMISIVDAEFYTKVKDGAHKLLQSLDSKDVFMIDFLDKKLIPSLQSVSNKIFSAASNNNRKRRLSSSEPPANSMALNDYKFEEIWDGINSLSA